MHFGTQEFSKLIVYTDEPDIVGDDVPATSSGTFSADLIAGPDGNPASGTWSYSGTYHPRDDDILPDGEFSFSGSIVVSPSSDDPDVLELDLTSNDPQFNGFAVFYHDDDGTWRFEVYPSFTLLIPDPRGGDFVFKQGFGGFAEFSEQPPLPILPPIISIDQYTRTVTEGGEVSITLKRSGRLDGESTVVLTTQDGAAVSSGTNEDFTARQVLVRFEPGQTTATVTIVTTHDQLEEVNENFGIRLLDPVNASLGFSTGNVTILDDDRPRIRNGTDLFDIINVNPEDDAINARGGNDIVNWSPGGGNVTVDGGTGNDTMVVYLPLGVANTTRVTKNSDGTVTVEGSGGTSFNLTLDNVETLKIVGNRSPEEILLGPLKDTQISDNTVFVDGGAGNDKIDGSLLDKRLVASGGADRDTILGGTANDSLNGGAGTDALAGGDGNDSLSGGDQNDTLDGGTGNDVLLGGAGNDLFDFGVIRDGVDAIRDGADSFHGGAGDDAYVLDLSGRDQVFESPGGGLDLINVMQSYSLAELPNVEHLFLFGGANSSLVGNSSANWLRGNSGVNTLNGGLGNDTLSGGSGRDLLKGGGGNDTLFWDAADARADGGGGKNDTLKLGVNLNVLKLANGKLLNIEGVDMSGSGNNTLTLNKAEVLDLSRQSNTLTVLGDLGDRVDLRSAGWSLTSTSGGFETWKSGAAIVKVETELNII